MPHRSKETNPYVPNDNPKRCNDRLLHFWYATQVLTPLADGPPGTISLSQAYSVEWMCATHDSLYQPDNDFEAMLYDLGLVLIRMTDAGLPIPALVLSGMRRKVREGMLTFIQHAGERYLGAAIGALKSKIADDQPETPPSDVTGAAAFTVLLALIGTWHESRETKEWSAPLDAGLAALLREEEGKL